MSFLESYVDYASNVTDAPIEFHDYLALATAGVAIGRKRYFSFGDTDIFPNFYLVILAPSTDYHKSTCLFISEKTVRAVNPTKVLPSDFSQEKMIEDLQNNPTGIMYYSEFRTLMTMLQKDWHIGTKSFLTSLYDCYPISQSRKNSSYDIQDPFVSIVSGTTVSWFLSAIKEGDIEGGFLSRFIFVHSTKKIREDSIPPRPNIDAREKMQDELSVLDNLSPSEMILSDEAVKIYDRWYKHHREQSKTLPGEYGNLFVRLKIYAIKIAMVVQTCANPNQTEITEDSINRALEYVNWLYSSTLNLCKNELSFNTQDKNEKKILKIIREKEKISHAHLLQYSHMNKWHFEKLIETLIEKQYVTKTIEKIDGSQKPSTLYSTIVSNS